jgi:Arc/MetJ-type ribon-helix-helix transcriptional regulator
VNITLPREQQEWLEAPVKAGAYDSIDDAISRIVATRTLRELMKLESVRRTTTKLADQSN